MSERPTCQFCGNAVSDSSFDAEDKACSNCQSAIEFGENKAEQRIIALLEEHTGCGYQHDEERRCYCDAIALIKGEQK